DHFCFLKKYRPASSKHLFGTIPTISEPVTRKPRLLADSTQASNAACSDVSSMLVRFIETWVVPYSSTYHPIALTCFNIPGIRTGCPLASSTVFPAGVPSSVFTRPCSRTSNATEFARLTDLVLRLTLYATRNWRAPITVPPDFSLKLAGPKSGFQGGCLILSKNPSYSPARITARLAREGSRAAFSYR